MEYKEHHACQAYLEDEKGKHICRNGRRGHIVCTFPPKLVGDVPPFLEWLQGYARNDMDCN